jgi:predicted amidophosphoribosyltransferase
MRLGIEEINGKTYCANCKKVVSAGSGKFCANCSAPLTKTAVEEYKENIHNVKRDVIRNLNKIAKENKTDSLEAVLDEYLDNMD